jgi:hypothetical protein
LEEENFNLVCESEYLKQEISDLKYEVDDLKGQLVNL